MNLRGGLSRAEPARDVHVVAEPFELDVSSLRSAVFGNRETAVRGNAPIAPITVNFIRKPRVQLEASPGQRVERGAGAPGERQKATRLAGSGAATPPRSTTITSTPRRFKNYAIDAPITPAPQSRPAFAAPQLTPMLGMHHDASCAQSRFRPRLFRSALQGSSHSRPQSSESTCSPRYNVDRPTRKMRAT